MASTFRVEDILDIINSHELASARVYALIALLERRRSVGDAETEISVATARLKRDKAWTPRSDCDDSSRVCDFVTEIVSKYEFERKRESRKESRKRVKQTGDPERFRSEVHALLAGLPSS